MVARGGVWGWAKWMKVIKRCKLPVIRWVNPWDLMNRMVTIVNNTCAQSLSCVQLFATPWLCKSQVSSVHGTWNGCFKKWMLQKIYFMGVFIQKLCLKLRLKIYCFFSYVFCVKVPRRQDDEKNNIRLELMQHDNTKKYLLLLGSVQVHLYEVIQVCIKSFFHLGITLSSWCLFSRFICT